MHLKQYTENDYFVFWLLHNRENGPDLEKILPGMSIDFFIEKPTPYAVERHLGTPYDLPSLRITDDYWREYTNRKTTNWQFMQNASEEYLYLTLPDCPIHHIGQRLVLDVHINSDHPNITTEDWWYETRPHVKFTAVQWLTYLWRSSIKGNFFDPSEMGISYQGCPEQDKHDRAIPGLFTSIFAPTKPEEIMDANMMAYIIFDGLWDDEDCNQEFREKSGLDTLIATRQSMHHAIA